MIKEEYMLKQVVALLLAVVLFTGCGSDRDLTDLSPLLKLQDDKKFKEVLVYSDEMINAGSSDDHLFYWIHRTRMQANHGLYNELMSRYHLFDQSELLDDDHKKITAMIDSAVKLTKKMKEELDLSKRYLDKIVVDKSYSSGGMDAEFMEIAKSWHNIDVANVQNAKKEVMKILEEIA